MLQEIQEHILWHPLGFIIVSKSVSPCSVTPFFDLSCWISTPETVKCTSYTLICDVHVSHIQFVNWFYGVYSKTVVFKWSLLGFMLYFALLKLLSQTVFSCHCHYCDILPFWLIYCSSWFSQQPMKSIKSSENARLILVVSACTEKLLHCA